MKVQIRPSNMAQQAKRDEGRAAGLSEAEVRTLAAPFLVDWPDHLSLPRQGDSINVGWANGFVQYVQFCHDGHSWQVAIKLTGQSSS